jgi:hypothetical protein
MAALKGLLGETCDVIEASMLEKIEADTGLRDWNLESTVDLLKKSYR